MSPQSFADEVEDLMDLDDFEVCQCAPGEGDFPEDDEPPEVYCFYCSEIMRVATLYELIRRYRESCGES